MKINFIFKKQFQSTQQISIIIIHGLFGDLNNLGIIAKNLQSTFNILQVDLRNHGKSFHADSMNYEDMSNDIIILINYLKIKKCILIGHSIGGKVAMNLCKLIPNNIIKIIILDIAPVNYIIKEHNKIFIAIEYVNKMKAMNRNQAFQMMRVYLDDIKIILFLLKSFHQGKWKFNFQSIENNYPILNKWNPSPPCLKPTLFIKGALSPYLNQQHYTSIFKQFPNALIYIIPEAHHWIHIDQPKILLKKINEFVNKIF